VIFVSHEFSLTSSFRHNNFQIVAYLQNKSGKLNTGEKNWRPLCLRGVKRAFTGILPVIGSKIHG